MAVLFDTGIFSVIGIASEILVGAKLYWYEAGTSTPLATYSDPDLTTPNANPVVANGAGRFPTIYLQTQLYKYILTKGDSDPSSPLVTRDDYDGVGTAGPDGSSKVGFLQDGGGATPRTVHDKLVEAPESPQDFAGSDTAAFDSLLNSRAAGVDAIFPSQDYIGTFDIQRSAVSVSGPLGCLENDTGPLNVGLRPATTGAGTHTVLIGGTTDILGRVNFANAEVSGDDGSGNMAESALLLKSLTNSTFDNCSFRDGIKTIDINPQEGPAVTAVAFSKAWVRNQTTGINARCLSVNRSGSDVNYVTAVTFAQSHFNGPVNGFATEQQGAFPTTLSFSQTYFDVKPWRGAFVKDGHTLSGYFAQIDPGALGVPVIETDADPTTDPTRIIGGNWRIGSQQMKFRTAQAVGTIAGNVLTVTSLTGTIAAGQDVDALGMDHTNGGVDPTGGVHITINAFGSGGTSGTGGIGTYQLSIAQPTLTSRTFSIGSLATFPAEMDWFLYRACLNQPYIRGVMQFDNQGPTFGAGPRLFGSGTDLVSQNRTNFMQAIQFFGGTANATASLDADDPTGGFRVTALGTATNTNIRLDPKGTGAVQVNGYGLLPFGLTQDIGRADLPFVDIYAVNALHVTSDARSKNWQTAIADSPDKAKYLDASKAIHAKFGFFTWNDSDDEGWHCGNMAQDVIQAFIDAELESSITGPFKHSMFAYDTWEADDKRESGNRYTLSGEFDKFMIWAMGERLNALEAA